jgi:arylsulfatase A
MSIIKRRMKMAERKKAFTRRNFLKGALILGGVATVGGITARLRRNHVGRDYHPQRTQKLLDDIKPADPSENLPNIIIILVDDLGYGDWGIHDSDLIETPNLDRMADEGVVMTNFYASAPVCTPSRAALLTGRYPIRSHMTLPLYPKNHHMEYFLKLVDRYQYDVTGMPEDEALLPELLQRRGYKTGMVGKWHLGDQPGHLPKDNGFNTFYGVLYSNDMSKLDLWRDDEIEIPSLTDQSELTQKYTQEALQFIEKNKEGPFFLYLAHTAVHEPLFASNEFLRSSQAGLYGDAVQELDWSVGEVLKKISDLDIDDQTLVIFTSDNGPWWQGSSGGLRGRKNNTMDGGFRVPFVARWPNTLPAGTICDELAINFDIFSTCLSITNTPSPSDRVIDGKDLLFTLQGKSTSSQETFYYYDGPILVAVRHKQWKYQRRHMSDNGGYPLFSHGPFLFDIENDPEESYNLINSRPDVAQMLSLMLDQWEAEMDSNVRGWL